MSTVQLVPQAGSKAERTVILEEGHCRLVGRMLGMEETISLNCDGSRVLDGGDKNLINIFLDELSDADGGFSFDSYARGSDIILDDESVSRYHCMLMNDGGRVFLVDLGSTNGSKVNNVKVGSQEVKQGDVLTLGEAVYRYA